MKKIRFFVSIYHFMGMFHFFRSVNIDYPKLSRSCLFNIVVVDFKDVNKAPIKPFTINILDQEVTNRR